MSFNKIQKHRLAVNEKYRKEKAALDKSFLAMFFLGAFIWSIKKGQFDDPFTPGIRILFDESKKSSKTKNK